MKVVLDTNVFVSGVFFSGPPYQILAAWRAGRVALVVSPEILDEYARVGRGLGRQFPRVDLTPFLELLLASGLVYRPEPLPESVCQDPDDDKFLACALVAGCKLVVSGDKHLLHVSGYHGIAVIRPRRFVDAYLETSEP